MWQNLVLAFIVGWVARGAGGKYMIRRRRGLSVVESITNSTDRARRRVPRATEMP
jgi:hypothetical protein